MFRGGNRMVQAGSRRISLLAGVALALLLPGLLSAGAVGTLNINGINGVIVNGPVIDFGTPPNISSSTPVTGDFLAIATGTPGTLLNLNQGVETVGPPFGSLPGFLTVGTFNFTLMQIPASTAPTCVNSATTPFCAPRTLANPTPFTFAQTDPNNLSVSFAVAGTVVNTLTPGDAPNPFVGSFTTQFSDPGHNTVQALLAAVAAGPVQASFSANFTSSPVGQVPEPGPMTLTACGLGLLVFSAALRRRFGRRLN